MILADKITELRKKERLVAGRAGRKGRCDASVSIEMGKRPVDA